MKLTENKQLLQTVTVQTGLDPAQHDSICRMMSTLKHSNGRGRGQPNITMLQRVEGSVVHT